MSDEYLYEITDKLNAFNNPDGPQWPCHPVDMLLIIKVKKWLAFAVMTVSSFTYLLGTANRHLLTHKLIFIIKNSMPF